MEKKKLHRLVGILIFTAVALIILPLLITQPTPPSTQSAVDAPPFAGSEPHNTSSVSDQPPLATPEFASEPSSPASKESVPLDAQSETSAYQAPNQVPEINPTETSIPETEPVTPPISSEIPSTSSQPEQVSTAKPAGHSQISSNLSKSQKQSISPKTSAWAVQMGHFHNHGNAIRLANRLRLAGYNAFTREIVARTGTVGTRVYVGPESRESAAKKLYADIHTRLGLDGIVIPFEPLML